MMEPENHIDEREELRMSIKKGCRSYTIFYMIMGILFFINGIVHLDNVSESKLYLCPLIALMLVSAIAMGFYAHIYDRIRRATTAHEMKHFNSLMGADTVFSKLILITMTFCFMIAAVLGLIDKSPWYVIVLVVLGIGAIIGVLWWLIKHTPRRNTRDIDIEKLLELEEQDNP